MAELHGWEADPFGIHEQRYFSLGQPTKLVRDGGVESYDPPPGGEPGTRSPDRSDRQSSISEPPPPAPGWWLASDGNWYAPELAESAASEHALEAAPIEPPPPAPGWWLASDGNWYPPESTTTSNGGVAQPMSSAE
jgi:hypothetical protein